MGIFRKALDKVCRFVEKTYTDRNTGELFLSVVFALGAVGVLFCLVWFALLCMKGISLGWLIFDIAIIAFCAWAIVKGVIPMAKEAFGFLEKLDDDKNQ